MMNRASSDTEMLDVRFAWHGVDATGTQHSGTLIAPDTDAVRAVLKRDKLFVVEIKALGPALCAESCRVWCWARVLSQLREA